MTLSAKGQFTGLMTAVSELSAPPGSLCKADNVVLRKPGAIENRQAFRPVSAAYSLTSTTPRSAALDGATVVYWDGEAWRSSAGTQRQYAPKAGVATSLPTKLRQDSFSMANARGYLYFPTSRGVLRSNGPTDTTWTGAGLTIFAGQSYRAAVTLTAGTLMASNTRVAYRFVARKTLPNGMILRSRPSGVLEAINTSSGSRAPQVGVVAAPTISGVAADSVEIYRSRVFPSNIQPDDEMMLVAVVPVTNTVGPAVTDHTPDSQRGAALYTSPSRGGIQNANDTPPACAFMELYRGCLFFGNVAGKQRLTISYSPGDRAGSATGVGVRAVGGDVLIGSNQITNLSSTVGLQVGMVLLPGYFAITYMHITAISGTTITMSGSATSTLASAPLWIADAVQVTPNGAWAPVTDANGGTGSPFASFLSYQHLGSDVGAYNVYPPITGKTVTLVLEETSPNGAPFTIRATHGDEYEPPLPLAGATALSSTKDVYPNGIIYSDPDQPEHVPPKNFFLVGDNNKAILGLCATRDSLFIFKEDGIWRLSGTNGQWRVDPFDLTTFCVLPSSIKRLDNAIYMLANKGVVRVSESGVELLSSPIQDMVTALVDNALTNFSVLGYYKLTGMDGCAATVDARNNEYILSVGTVPIKSGGQLLVYNARTDAWSTFSFSEAGTRGFAPTGLGVSESGAPLVLHVAGVRASSYAPEIVGGETSLYTSDGHDVVTVTNVVGSGTTATLTYSPTLIVQPGDAITIDTKTYVVLTANSSTEVTVSVPRPMTTPTTGTGTFWRSIVCTVQPHGFSNPMFTGKQWVNTLLAFTRFVGPVKATISYASSTPLRREAEQTATEDEPFFVYDGFANYALGTLFRQGVPRAHARAWLLRPTLRWTMPFGETVLDTIAANSRDYANAKDQSHSTSEG